MQHSQTLKELLFKMGELSRDIGTSVAGKDAVRYGLINEIGGLAHAQHKLNELIKINKESKGFTELPAGWVCEYCGVWQG